MGKSNAVPRSMFKLWSERLQDLEPLEQLIVASAAVGLIVWLYIICSATLAIWRSHDAAVSFASKLRDLEIYAHDHNCFLHIDIEMVPATREHHCAFVVTDQSREIERGLFPDEIFVTGTLTIDPQGVPTKTASFCFTCGKRSETVEIGASGHVSLH